MRLTPHFQIMAGGRRAIKCLWGLAIVQCRSIETSDQMSSKSSEPLEMRVGESEICIIEIGCSFTPVLCTRDAEGCMDTTT